VGTKGYDAYSVLTLKRCRPSDVFELLISFVARLRHLVLFPFDDIQPSRLAVLFCCFGGEMWCSSAFFLSSFFGKKLRSNVSVIIIIFLLVGLFWTQKRRTPGAAPRGRPACNLHGLT